MRDADVVTLVGQVADQVNHNTEIVSQELMKIFARVTAWEAFLGQPWWSRVWVVAMYIFRPSTISRLVDETFRGVVAKLAEERQRQVHQQTHTNGKLKLIKPTAGRIVTP